MSSNRLFLDTVFIQALLNSRDQYHSPAVELLPQVKAADEVWLTEAILTEVGNALSAIDRAAASQFIQQSYRIRNMYIVSVDRALFKQGLTLYQSRGDKHWGLTDCISFSLMKQQQLTVAVTADRHFIQAGYRALMLE
ncbi:MAG: nucleic acid-binding protein [Phormidesmis sp.]